MDPRAYWIWAQHAFGAGSPKPWQFFRRFSGGLQEFYSHGPSLWNRMEQISEKESRALMLYTPEEAEALLEYCEKFAHSVLTPECEKYPDALRNIFDPPAVLYLKGPMPDVDHRPTISIVGARKATEESVAMASAFGHQLALGGATVVSGGALGIDSAALLGALSASGRPISVLPVCLNSNYVAQNGYLRSKILEWGGTLLTEYPTENGVARGTFQVRNRLISGLSCGTLIVQAAQKSGTMITAKFAREQDRDVFVYPGPENDALFAGGRGLIEDGAMPVTNGEEILKEYLLRFTGHGPGEAGGNPRRSPVMGIEMRRALQSVVADARPVATMKDAAGEMPEGLSEEDKRVWAVLEQTPQHLSTLVERSGLPIGRVLSILTRLELEGKIKSLAGKQYTLA